MIIDQSKIYINLYFKHSTQRLGVYRNTPQKDIISSIKDVLELENNKKLYFLDEEGTPIVITSFLPNDIKIFVQNDDKITLGSHENESNEWKWSTSLSNPKFINNNFFKTHDTERTIVYGDTKFTKGIHYWTIKISQIMCCHDFGITKSELPKNFDVSYHTPCNTVIGLPGLLPGEGGGPSNTGCSNLNLKNVIIGFYLDMDRRQFMIMNEIKRKVYVKEKVDFCPVIPFYTSRKHCIEVELLNSNAKVPLWLESKICEEFKETERGDSDRDGRVNRDTETNVDTESTQTTGTTEVCLENINQQNVSQSIVKKIVNYGNSNRTTVAIGVLIIAMIIFKIASFM